MFEVMLAFSMVVLHTMFVASMLVLLNELWSSAALLVEWSFP